MPPGHALRRSEPLRGEPTGHRIHPHLGIDQNVGRIAEDRLAPAFGREGPANKTVAELRRYRGRRIPQRPGVIADYLEFTAVELAHPTFDEQFPHRMP